MGTNIVEELIFRTNPFFCPFYILVLGVESKTHAK